MRFLKKPIRISIHIVLWTMFFSCLVAHPFSQATSSPPGDRRDYILILNTYTESSSWSRNIVNDIVTHIEGIDNLEVYTENMNMLLMRGDQNDEIKLRDFERMLEREYGKNPPRMLVLLGAPIAVLRDFLKETWPDAPLIYCSEMDYIGPAEAYLKRRAITREEREPLYDKAATDNLTLIQSPFYLRQNIELMQRMIPGMDSLVFVGDGRYINQQADYDLRELLAREYRHLHYRFYSAEKMSTEALLDSLNTLDNRTTGVLFSSWHFVKKISGSDLPVTDSYRVIASVEAPIFSLTSTGLSTGGLVGSYAYDDSNVSHRILETIDAVLAGEQPRDIPFYVPTSAHPIFNYPTLVRKGLSTNTCPSNSVFLNKPASTLERYKWPIVAGGVLMFLFILFQQWRIRAMHNIEEARKRESESQARYFNLFNRMPIIYIQEQVLFDADGNPSDTRFSDVNAHFERMFFPRERIIGKTIGELLPEQKNEFLHMVRLVLTENRTITYPFYYDKLDMFFEVIVSRSYNDDCIDIFCLDGTALHKAQNKLASINRKLAMALDVADIVPWKWDLANHTIYFDSNQMRDPASHEEQEHMQHAISEERYFGKVVEEDRDRVRSAYDRLIDGSSPKFREQYRIRIESGSRPRTEWVEVQAGVETRDRDGRPLTIVGSSLVITQRKQMEQELLSARDRAEESNRLKSAFLANMSHEIRTPLNAIVGFSEILANTEEQQEKQEYVSIIENNNALLLQLIGDILDLSKIEAGTLEFVHTSFDLNALMNESKDTVGLKVREGVELTFEQPAGECCILTDRNRLAQVLINLLTNAAKFTHEGSIRFGYELRGGDKELYFWVTDTGCGIPVDRKDQVFDRFVKLNSFKQGTGLGLSICRTIVEHLGGQIGVESDEGQGATFWFTLPYVAGETEPEEEQTLPPLKVERDKLTILIAEDNESNYRLFESILRRDYRLLHAWNGQEAVELFRKHQPHIVLMDINMPIMNGYEATAEIRRISADVPIVAVTAFAYASDEQKVMSSGFDGYMPKPINASQLRAQILDMLRKRLTLI